MEQTNVRLVDRVLDVMETLARYPNGVIYAEGSTMIGERVYHKPKQWNVYQPEIGRAHV